MNRCTRCKKPRDPAWGRRGRCTYCGQRGERGRPPAPAGSRLERRPDGFTLFLLPQPRWLAPAGLGLALLGLVLLVPTSLHEVWDLDRLQKAAVGLAFLVSGGAGAFLLSVGYQVFQVQRQTLRISNSLGIGLAARSLALGEVEQLYLREWVGPRWGLLRLRSRQWELCGQVRGGTRPLELHLFLAREDAEYLEFLLEEHLEIADREVSDEAPPG